MILIPQLPDLTFFIAFFSVTLYPWTLDLAGIFVHD